MALLAGLVLLGILRRLVCASGTTPSVEEPWHAAPRQEGLRCPRCQAIGTVRTKDMEEKARVSRAKAITALRTGGLSVLVVGLARRESRRQARCDACGTLWLFLHESSG
jgi:hypothetical protein